MNKKVLVLGGAGYVGAVLVPFLIKYNYQVTVYDLFIYGKTVLKKNKNLTVIQGDIRDINFLKEIIKKNDYIIHLACISNDPSFELNKNLGKSINLESFEPIVEMCSKNIKRFIFASSSSVYGVKKEKNVNEEVKLEPLTDYSLYKVKCEKILFDYHSENFITTILRPATVCGYSSRQRLDVVVNILTNYAYHKRKITVFGGNQLRPNIHISDMVNAYYKILESDQNLISKKIYNVGYENQKVKTLAEIVKDVIGKDVKILFESSDDNRSYHISSDKIKDELNFKPQFTIKDAVKDLLIAFQKGKLPNSLSDDKYFNIKKMQSINLS